MFEQVKKRKCDGKYGILLFLVLALSQYDNIKLPTNLIISQMQ